MWHPGSPTSEEENLMHGSYASSPEPHAKFPTSAGEPVRGTISVESEVLKAVQEMDRGSAWEGAGHHPGSPYHQPQPQYQQYPQPQQRQVVFQQPQQQAVHCQQQHQVHYQQSPVQHQQSPVQHQVQYQPSPVQLQGQYQPSPVQQQVQYQPSPAQQQVQYQPSPVQHQAAPMRQPSAQAWQPATAEQQIFHYQNTQGDPKEVQWPPEETSQQLQQLHERQMHGPGAPMTMPLRREVPLQQEPVAVVRSVPRATTPFRVTKWRGDEKWPPETARQKSEPPKETVRPAKPQKDYMPFFEANKLPANYPGYKAPPGTQFIGIDGVEPGYYYEQQQQQPPSQ